jgi:amino acid transporter
MDPSQYNHMHGMIASLVGVFMILGFAMIAFFVFLFWRILDKAGLSGPLSLLLLIWPIGLIIVACILAFSNWKVIPAPQLYPGLQPYPPPPPSYPPPPPAA